MKTCRGETFMRTGATLGAFIIGLALAGCKQEAKRLGDPPPGGVEAVSIQVLLRDQARYAGRTVVIEGRVGGVGCVDCGGILVTEGTWRLPVEPADKQAFRIPARAGARLRVWGVLEVEAPKPEGHAENGEPHAEGEKKDADHDRTHESFGRVELKASGLEWL
jgi:hypothetical protein